MTRQFFLASLFCLVSTLAVATAPRSTNVLYVDGVHGNDQNNCKSQQKSCKTIGRAISLATPWSTILVAPATYSENLEITIDLNIVGAGAKRTIIDGQALNNVVYISDENAHVFLSGFTIRNGSTYANGCGGGGGGIANFGSVTVVDSVLAGNIANGIFADALGGGICSTGTALLERIIVTGNELEASYSSCGGGIANLGGVMAIEDSTISNNSSLTTDTYGAGICNGGTLEVSQTTINGNETGDGAYTEGGGIDNDGIATIINSTITGNASQGGVGGGIANYGGAMKVINTTVSGNTAWRVAGGIATDGNITIENSIVSDNATNCSGGIVSKGYNLSSDTSCPFTAPGDLNNTEPLLGPLRNNGGPTPTMAELPGSPTLDAGNPNGCTDNQGNLLKTDQRGAPRPGKHKNLHRCDMGAFERQSD